MQLCGYPLSNWHRCTQKSVVRKTKNMTHYSKPSQSRKPRKGARTAIALLTLTMLLPVRHLSAAMQPRPAAVSVTMPKRYHVALHGEMTLTGNSSLTCLPTPGYAPTCAGAQTGANNGLNDKFNMVYLNNDTDPSTFNATSAQLDIPPGTDVRWAGLYWGGNVTQGVGGQAAPNTAISNTVWIKMPGGTYQNVNGQLVGVDNTTGQSRSYGAFAEITQLVRGAQGGEYTVANIQAGTGVRDDLGASGGLFGGWSLLVIYIEKTLPLARLQRLGLRLPRCRRPTATLTSRNFVTPLTGPFRTSIAAMVFEGDKGLPGDYMLLNGARVSDTLHLANNAFNGGITRFGAPVTRNPAFVNSLGVDINTIAATGIIPNGATSANLTLPTTADNYFPTMIAMAIDIYEPLLVMNKAAEDVNGGYLLSGDIIRYTVALSKHRQRRRAQHQHQRPNPAEHYVSARVTARARQPGQRYRPEDRSIDADIAEYDGARNLVHYRIGRLVNSVGGGVAIGESATVEFCVTVNPATPDGTIIPNTATALYNGTLLTATFEISSSASVTVQVRSPDLSIFKTDNGTTAAPGDTVVYDITAKNEAPFSIARNVILTETLPP